MGRFIGKFVLCAIGLAALGAATPAAAQDAQQCDPVMYHSAEPNCWGQYEGHKDFTTEFDIRVDRVWQEQLQDMPDFTMLFMDVTRQDTGQQMLLKCGWWAGEDKASEKCFDLGEGATYRVRAARGYGYIYVYQPINGTMTWLETTCEAPSQDICI